VSVCILAYYKLKGLITKARTGTACRVNTETGGQPTTEAATQRVPLPTRNLGSKCTDKYKRLHPVFCIKIIQQAGAEPTSVTS